MNCWLQGNCISVQQFLQYKLICDKKVYWAFLIWCHNLVYYMEESVLLGTKPLVDSIHHFIRDLSGVFSVCHLCECRIVQWRHDSRLLLLLNWFLHIIKRTLHVGSKKWILCSRHRVISSIYTKSIKLPFQKLKTINQWILDRYI